MRIDRVKMIDVTQQLFIKYDNMQKLEMSFE